jgi:hypothetical protein
MPNSYVCTPDGGPEVEAFIIGMGGGVGVAAAEDGHARSRIVIEVAA